jgi:hypothetical protein
MPVLVVHCNKHAAFRCDILLTGEQTYAIYEAAHYIQGEEWRPAPPDVILFKLADRAPQFHMAQTAVTQ